MKLHPHAFTLRRGEKEGDVVGNFRSSIDDYPAASPGVSAVAAVPPTNRGVAFWGNVLGASIEERLINAYNIWLGVAESDYGAEFSHVAFEAADVDMHNECGL